MRTRTATPFPELNDLLTDFVGRVRSILDTHLVGVYLTGSFALDSGDAASDCDREWHALFDQVRKDRFVR